MSQGKSYYLQALQIYAEFNDSYSIQTYCLPRLGDLYRQTQDGLRTHPTVPFIIEVRFTVSDIVMSLSLTPELEQAIVEKVKSGRYQSVDEVVLEGLRLLEERDRALDEQRLEELRQKIAIGSEQIAKGQVTDGEIVFERLRAKIRREYQV